MHFLQSLAVGPVGRPSQGVLPRAMGDFSPVPEHVPGHSSGIAVGDAREATLNGEPVTHSLA